MARRVVVHLQKSVGYQEIVIIMGTGRGASGARVGVVDTCGLC